MSGAKESWDDVHARGQKFSQFETMSLKEKFDFVEGLLHFPALTVMVFFRRKVGYRLLNPVYLFVTGFLLILAQNFSTPYYTVTETTIYPYPLTLYVVAMIIWAYIQRWWRWNDLKRGVHWHTYSRGISYFSFLPLRQDIVARFVDPAVCMLIGVVVMYFVSKALGVWLMIGALAFLVGEVRFYDLVLGNTFDMLDSLEESRISGEFMKSFGGTNVGNALPVARRLEETAGIPTGVGDDLIRAVQKRRAEAAERSAEGSSVSVPAAE